MSRRVPPTESFGKQNAQTEQLQRDAADALRFDGSQFVRLYEKMQALIANLSTTVTDLVNSIIPALTYTRAETDAKIASPGAITPTTVAASGAVSGTSGTFNSGLYSLDARNFVVSTGYAGAWIDSSGHFGISPSTRRFKTDIQEWVEDPEKLLNVLPVKYHLSIPERQVAVLDEHGAPVTGEDGPVTYTMPAIKDAPDAPLRAGFIAEDLVAAGFDEQVVFDEDGNPLSINYAEMVVPHHIALRWLRDQLAEARAENATLRARIDGIAAHLNLEV